MTRDHYLWPVNRMDGTNSFNISAKYLEEKRDLDNKLRINFAFIETLDVLISSTFGRRRVVAEAHIPFIRYSSQNNTLALLAPIVQIQTNTIE